MKKALSFLLILLTLILFVNAEQTFSTSYIDDYTNSKSGAESLTYTFTLGVTKKNAVGNSKTTTDMSWNQWLNIKAEGFNGSGLGIATSSGFTRLGTNTYTIKYVFNGGDTFNDDLTDGAVILPGLPKTGYTLTWYEENTFVTSVGNAGDSYTPGRSLTLYAKYTANSLEWDDERYDFYYSAQDQTQILTPPSNGTGNTSYSKVGGDSALTVSPTGTVTIAGGTKTGKYSIQVKAHDNTSGAERINTFYFYIYPTLAKNSIDVSYGDKQVWIYMNGLSAGTTATSSSGTLAPMPGDDNAGFVITLNDKFTSNTSITFTVLVDDGSKDYIVNLGKQDVVLFVHSNEVIYNNAMQTPLFYVNQIEQNEDYLNQSDLFTWELSCPDGVTNCSISPDKQQAQNVVINGLSIGKYNLKVTVKSTEDKPFEIYDENGNTNSKTITFTINPFVLRTVDESQTITNHDGSTSTITLPANTTITYDNQAHGHVGLPVVKTTINGSEITLVENQDYTIKYKQGSDFISKPNDIGSYTVIINGINNYTGEISQDFDVVTKNIEDDDLIIDAIEDQEWTGSQIKPGVNIKHGTYTLIEGTDYTLSYSNNINVGTATITITGIGNYTGEKDVHFNIINSTIKYDVVNGSFVYNGEASNGGANVIVNEPASGATVQYYNNSTNSWQSTVPTFTDVGTYPVRFKITATGYTAVEVPNKLTVSVLKANNSLELYSDSAMTIKTASGNIIFGPENKTTIYYKSTFPGTVTAVSDPTGIASVNISGNRITITPIKVGETNIKFTIAGTTNTAAATAEYYYVVKLENITSTPENKTYAYDYKEHEAVVSVNPSDSTIKYTWNGQTTNIMPKFKNVGTYTITYVASKTNYNPDYGSVQLKITPRSITGFRANLSGIEFNYTGTKIEPSVTVIDERRDLSMDSYTLTKGIDYIVSYENNVVPGTARVKITGIGNYSGEINLTFEIKPVQMTVLAVDGVGDYTGYPQIGQDKEPSTIYKKASVTVISDSTYDLQFSSTEPVCPSNKRYCTKDEELYNSGYSIPKFTDVGVHTVWYRVKAQEYQTVTGTLTITIKKAKLKVPTLYGGDLLYTGQSQEPAFMNYNSKFMKKSGRINATAPGEYETTFTLIDLANTIWEDDTTAPKTVKWAIRKISIKDNEKIVYDSINYGEQKQIMLENGKVTFERPGYKQIAWAVESPTGDKACIDRDDGTGFYTRECNYDYTKLLDIGAPLDGATVGSKVSQAIPTGDNKETCGENADKIWVNGYCFNTKQDEAYDLFAVWKKSTYRIKYDMCNEKGCGALSGNPETQPAYDNEFTVDPPKRLGYDFIGWTITGMDNSPHIIGPETTSDTEFTTPEEWANESLTLKNLTTVDGATVTLKANWRPIQYEVRFNGNKDNSAYVTDYGDKNNAYSYKDENGNLTTAILSGSTASYTATYDIPFKLTKNGYSLTGYTFAGWNTRPDGNGPMSNINTTATVSHIDLYNRGTYQMFADQLGSADIVNPEIAQDVTNLANLEITTDHINKHQTSGTHIIDAMNEIIREGITLYAQWEPDKNITFTVTYWKQNMYNIDDNGSYNTSVDVHNNVNYAKVGTETYTAVTDTNINITPYNYDMAAQSGITNQYITKINVADTNANKNVVATNGNSTYRNNNQGYINLISNPVGNDDTFYGFTPEGIDNHSLLSPFQNVLLNVSRVNNLNALKEKDLTDGSYPANSYTYTVLPDGSRNINIYYRRNIYKLYYEDNGGTNNNVKVRLYQEPTTFTDPIDGALKCGNNNGQPNGIVGCARDSGNNTSNTGKANFLGWFRTSNLDSADQVVGVNGDVSTNETIYAKWMQYRYTVSNTGWTTWGRSE